MPLLSASVLSEVVKGVEASSLQKKNDLNLLSGIQLSSIQKKFDLNLQSENSDQGNNYSFSMGVASDNIELNDETKKIAIMAEANQKLQNE